MFKKLLASASLAVVVLCGATSSSAHASTSLPPPTSFTITDEGAVIHCICESCGGPIDPEGHCRCS